MHRTHTRMTGLHQLLTGGPDTLAQGRSRERRRTMFLRLLWRFGQ